MEEIDKKALEILKKCYSYNPKTHSVKGATKDEIEYAKSKGLMFDELEINHEQAIHWLLNEVSKIEKEKVTDLFLASLSTKNLAWRSGLGSYALAYRMPLHDFERAKRYSSGICKICGYHELLDIHELSLMNFTRLIDSCHIISEYIVMICFYLQQFNKLEYIKPKILDFEIFNMILEKIQNFEKEGTIGKLEKEISKIKVFKSNKYQRVSLLEALGFCSILETEKYKGFYPNFIPWNKRNEGHIRNDWQYPVQFWKGKDGINKKALDFWFGNYKEIKIN